MASTRGNHNNTNNNIPAACRKMVESLKEIVNGGGGLSDAEIYAALKDSNMDPNEAVNRLLSQDPFHEVKSKREKKKEFKDTTESRPRGGGSTSNRGSRSGTDRYAGRGVSSQFSSSESGGLHGKSKRENGTSSYTSSFTPSYGAAPTNTYRTPPAYSSSVGYDNKASTFSVTDSTATVSQQPLPVFQSSWGAPGQKSMADIVKMGRPQNKAYSTQVPPQPPSTHYDDYASKAPITHGEQHDSYHASNDDDWPVEQPQTVSVQSVVGPEPHVESESVGYERSNQYVDSETEEGHAEDENVDRVYEDHTAQHVSSRNIQEDAAVSAPNYDNDLYKNMDSFHPEDHAYEHREVEQDDALASAVNENMQQLNIQDERHLDEPEDEVPSVVIPNYLQVQTADCSHLSFGSFGSTTMNPGFSESFASRQLRNKVEDTPVEVDPSSVGPSETRKSEYFGDESIIAPENNPVLRTGPSSGNYDLPSGSQRDSLKQENAEVAHGNQFGFPSSTPGSGYSFDSTQLLNPGFPQSQTSEQMPDTTPFSNVMAAFTNSLPNPLAANGHSVRESDLSYSPFPLSQSMATKYANSAPSISGSTISMAEALKTGVFSSSQPTQQTPPGNTIPTGPALPHHLLHPYSQHTLPLGPFANMIGYPFLPQSYTYMPSGFQQAFAGNSSYQQLAAILPQYKNSVSVSSLPQSAAVPSGYGLFGNSTALPGNYQVNQPAGPAGSNLSYDDNYKENSQLLSLQQNENPATWVHGAGSRTMSAVPGSTYYGFQGQNQQPSGFRQGQQPQQQQLPSQSFGGATLNYPNYYHSQTGISQEHQLQQNTRDGSLVGGSQGQPKPQQQSQQLWQNSY
ncbi:uncharacterized protein LOC143560537 isoform X2 [Bidens hawaiensis]|uniref:uncharacterized protein LOC143560537 isoform X2 n=1 Tax=Bidens hawaiensis TaxID=980011 RepID=UPI00404B9865